MPKKEPLFPHIPKRKQPQYTSSQPKKSSEEEVAEIWQHPALGEAEINSGEGREKATGMGAKLGIIMETPTRTSARTICLFKSPITASNFAQWIERKGVELIDEGEVWYVKYRSKGDTSLNDKVYGRVRLVGDIAKSIRISHTTTGKFLGHEVTEIMYDEEEEEWRLHIYGIHTHDTAIETENTDAYVAKVDAEWLKHYGYEVAGVYNEWAVIFKIL